MVYICKLLKKDERIKRLTKRPIRENIGTEGRTTKPIVLLIKKSYATGKNTSKSMTKNIDNEDMSKKRKELKIGNVEL